MNHKPLVSVVVNCHDEGPLLTHTLNSVLAALQTLAREDTRGEFEVLLVLDSPNQMTVHAATKAEQHEQIRVLECNFQDLAKARNFGVSESSGEFIAFIDADDIWGSNWLLEAVKMARNNTEVHVLHPQLNYYFGHATSRDSSFVTKHIDSQSSEFDLFTLAFANYWTSSAFAQKSVFELVPYRPIDLNAKIGFEDWSFNIDCLVAGIHHSYVPKTIHFIRDKPTYRMRTTHSSFGSVRYPVSFLSTLSARRR